MPGASASPKAAGGPKKTRREREDEAIAAEEAALNAIDTYGMGAPTDRLQFGYAPSNADEARAFHSLTPAAEWRKARAASYRSAILRRQKAKVTNFETLESFFKLQRHWRQVASSNGRGRSAATGSNVGGAGDEAEDFLKQLALQNLGIGGAMDIPPSTEEDHAPPSAKRNRAEDTA
jgi:hypothetical protein